MPWNAEATALFRDRTEGPPGGLGCEVTLTGYSEHPLIMTSPDSTRADISVLAWLGTNRGAFFLRAEGPDNQNDMRMFFPLTGLQKEDPVAFDIRDRDAIGWSGIDHVEGVVEGPPPFQLSSKRKVAYVSCKPIARAAIERAMEPYEAKAKEAIAQLSSWKPNMAEADLGWNREHAKDARGRASELAAFGGWDDPRIAPTIESLKKAEAEVESAHKKVVVDERARIGAETTLEDGLVLRARRVMGDGPVDIELDVKNGSDRAIVLGSDFHQMEGFGVDGARMQFYPDESTYELKVPAGGATTVHYRGTLGAGFELPHAALIMRSHRRAVTIGIGRSFVSPVTNAKLVPTLECTKRSCVIALTTDGAPLEEARRGLRIEAKVRGRRSGFERTPGKIILDEKDIAAEDAAVSFSPEDARGELPWSVSTDR